MDTPLARRLPHHGSMSYVQAEAHKQIPQRFVGCGSQGINCSRVE